MIKLSNIFVVILFCLAVLSSWIGINYSNKCNKGLDDKQSASNKSFLISMTIMSVIIAIYKVLSFKNDSNLGLYFMTMVMCGITISASSIGIEFKNKCSDGLEKTSDVTLVLILIGSIITCFVTIYSQHESVQKAVNQAKSVASNKFEQGKVKAVQMKLKANGTAASAKKSAK